MVRRPGRRVRSVYAAPALVALASVIGLASALIGNDSWDALSWLALSLPLGVIGRTATRRRPASDR